MKFLDKYFEVKNKTIVTGMTDELHTILINEQFKKSKDSIIVLASTLFEANKIYNNLRTYTDDVLLFPMDDFLTSMILAVSPELKIKRLETLEKIKINKKSLIVTNLMGFLKFLPNKDSADKLHFKFEKGQIIDRSKLNELLERFGYSKESITTSTGEYSIRGFVVDIFLIQENHPIRIEFFDNQIESIRYFDESTQISIQEITEIDCKPYQEIITVNNSSLVDYLNNPTVIFIDYNQIQASYLKLCEEITEYTAKDNTESAKYMFSLDEIKVDKTIFLETFVNMSKDTKNNINVKSEELQNFNSDFELLEHFVKKNIRDSKTIIFFLSLESQIKKIKQIFPTAYITKNEIKEKSVNIINKKINKGFIIDNVIVISEYDIENTDNKPAKYKNTYRIGRKLKGFDELETGDFVVHILHGIGIYRGVITLTKNGIKKDYLQIDYEGNDKVYIPVEKIDAIYKYADKDGIKPKINKLGTVSWTKTKQQLKRKISDISEMLLKLYAERKKKTGQTFKKMVEEEIFAHDFAYEPTIDQNKAITEIDFDLSSKIPMDRLLCGDVGFGKTEVAFRAMFKTIINGFQVLYLCPTTILSKQQFISAKERFKKFAVNIALLNRFTAKKEQNQIIKDFKNGKIDILFGTHRLLSSDIEPKNLGLLVVDEEQRFGVTHKEKIKNLKKDVNVLTLSATPIPRTLKMAMSGLRDLSLIDTAPVDRYPVQTYVMVENELLIKDAIYKELSRDGQVFILYNRVESIEKQVSKIGRLVPDAKIVYAHGKMSKTELDKVMLSFINHESDILICTTIIETGIDIPNVNTLIIYDADNFGLSQLYQIRGRVGRSNKIAYAYLMYKKDKILNEIAVKRLHAIKEFTELGSGYKIAMRDLSIRGAGDILGSEQAGFISSVGIELFMKMIEDEMKKQRGEEVHDEESLESNALINVETHISDYYVNEESIKIEIHKKINEINSYDKLLEIKRELTDRFGKIPEEINIYMHEEWFEKLARKLKIFKINQNERFIEIELNEDISNNIQGDKLFLQVYSICPKFQLKYIRKRITVVLPILKLEKHFIFYLVQLLTIINNQLNKRE